MTNEPSFSIYFEDQHGFLDTASIGLLPKTAANSLHEAVDHWACGTARWFDDWLGLTDSARDLFAKMVHADAHLVATGPSTSVMVALIADALPPGSRVLTPAIEFTSNLFPYLVQAERGIEVISVDEDQLIEAIDSSISLVAVSAVQSANGHVTDLDAIKARASVTGTMIAVDATQAAGWLPLDMNGLDAIVCSGYKWLLSPRGTAYLALSERLSAMIRPLYANWYGGEVIADSFYGAPLRLSTSNRRLDPSPAWLSWVGAAQSLKLLDQIGVEAIYRHDVALATHFLTLIDQPVPSRPSAIISLELSKPIDPTALPLVVSVRGGRLRVSFHLYNTMDDVELAAKELKEIILPPN
ncbi:aminotransferase class V-fold PLP-dependent enzyme [Ferrimicrobium acidiphilum]|uniref:aminotransferase class V-fold PLP-dependent enzyme n=1 Tax=Ferrimicrobium acidiphilum TaxID=121039 RepID=UPI0023F31E77|nr:aminotransferase class V-fold PLP-dependent enzyme [Ferrimicrobium acidiphilum]